MKKFLFPSLIVTTLLVSAFTIFTAVNWQIAEGFAVKFAGTAVEGFFSKMTGDLVFDEKNIAVSKFSVSIDVNSINTGNWLKNRHAKSDSWFDAKQFPTITFLSNKFSKTSNGYTVVGTLDLHGIKKEITIPFTFSNNIFSGKFSVNRMDYGVGTMEGMSKKVSNEIKIDISIPVTKE
jgi:polyisoprenoid-binding protein YceI